MIVTSRHLLTEPCVHIRPGHCRTGGRAWFEAHGFDWRDFVRNGIDDAELTATGDGLVLDLVHWAHVCEHHNAFASAENRAAAVAEFRAWYAGGRRGR